MTVLHEFTGDPNNAWGLGEDNSLILDGTGRLYGTTPGGGLSGKGTIFSIKTDGSGFELLHSFNGADGSSPFAGLAMDTSGNLYGTNLMEVFTIRTDGTGFAVLHIFSGGVGDATSVLSPVILDGSGNLYGTSYNGGVDDLGTVYKLKTDGSGFSLLHSFTNGANHPNAGLVLDSTGSLYGVTQNGGGIFTIKTDGTGFSFLRFLAGSDGYPPRAGLMLDGIGNLYGTTYSGGSGKTGTVFSMKTDGSNFVVLHSFSVSLGVGDGENPDGTLILDGAGNLYGTTQYGGQSTAGTIFTVKTNGTGYAVLSSFLLPDGSFPSGSLIQDGMGNLYGTNSIGGPAGRGTIFTVKPDGTAYSVLHAFLPAEGLYPNAGLILDNNGYLYGTAEGGGAGNYGAVFKIKTSGSGFALLHSFGFETPYPEAPLILDNST
ncbi:MAG: choice-of-anchor tandem repeat GloVer-containing protein, partial [Thermoanaerobaculia bacterium]